jgi:hypothetical protein
MVRGCGATATAGTYASGSSGAMHRPSHLEHRANRAPPSAGSGRWRNCSAGPRRVGWCPGAPSHQWADSSLRVHTFATVVGLALMSLARIALGSGKSALGMIKTLRGIEATMVRVRTQERGRPATVSNNVKPLRYSNSGAGFLLFFHLCTGNAPNASAERIR